MVADAQVIPVTATVGRFLLATLVAVVVVAGATGAGAAAPLDHGSVAAGSGSAHAGVVPVDPGDNETNGSVDGSTDSTGDTVGEGSLNANYTGDATGTVGNLSDAAGTDPNETSSTGTLDGTTDVNGTLGTVNASGTVDSGSSTVGDAMNGSTDVTDGTTGTVDANESSLNDSTVDETANSLDGAVGSTENATGTVTDATNDLQSATTRTANETTETLEAATTDVDVGSLDGTASPNASTGSMDQATTLNATAGSLDATASVNASTDALGDGTGSLSVGQRTAPSAGVGERLVLMDGTVANSDAITPESDPPEDGDPTGPTPAVDRAPVADDGGGAVDAVPRTLPEGVGGPAALGGVVAVGLLAGLAVVGRHALATVGSQPPVTSFEVVRAYVATRGGGVVDSLRRFLWVRWYQRYDDSDPLEHDRRRRVYEAVEDGPGIHLSAISEETGVPLGTVRYHLKILEHENLIRRAEIRGKHCVFPVGVEPSELQAVEDDGPAAQVLEELASGGPQSVTDLAERLDRDPSTITHHVTSLEADGLVERERDGRAVVNRLSETADAVFGDDQPAGADRGRPAASSDD